MKRYLSSILITIIALLSTLSIQAQEVTSINELLQDTAFYDKLPIPMASISVYSEQTVAVIEEVEENLGLTPEQLDMIDSIFNDLSTDLSNFQGRINNEFLSTASTILLDKAISEVEQVDNRVNGYREIVQSEIQEKEVGNKKIDNLIIIWNETYKADRSTSLSDAIITNLREIISKLNNTDRRIDTYLNNLLEVELKLNGYHSDFDTIIKKLNEARDKANKNLWIPDSDPIWEIYSTKRDTVEVEAKLKLSFEKQKKEAIEYYTLYKTNIRFALFIVILIQIVFWFLRYKVLNEQIEDPKQKDNTFLRLFKKPFFPALLVGFYTAYIILPPKPFIVDEIIYLAGLIPFTIVLVSILLGKSRYLVIYLTFILALSVFSQLGFDIEIFSRTFMLAITILAIIFLILVLKDQWSGLQDQPRLRSAYRILAKTSLVILAICLIGNIIGNYTLTSILLYGVLSTAFLGIALYLFYLIAIGLIIAVLNSHWGQSFRIIKRYQRDIVKKIRRILVFVLVISFIVGSFRGFYVFDSFYEAIETFLITPYKLGSFSFTVNDILLFIVILLIASWISRFSQFILQEQVLFKSRKQKDLSASISSLVKFGIITIGFFIAALASGFPLDKITLLISAFGVGIGFGLQNIFNNLVSGIILVFERPLQVGDTIEVGQLLGVVKSIGIRASTIRTFDGSEVIVPNGNLISNELINWTLSDSQRRMIIKVGVEYGTDPNEVIKILMSVAKKDKELLEDPAPYVLFKEFGDSALGFELRCYTDSDDWIFILSDLHVKVNDAIKEAGIVIPFPQRDLHIKTMDPNIVKSVKATPRSK
jgi:small-conductance mechanosensitive channel